MAFHELSTTDYRDFATKLVQACTSKYISAAVVAAGGTGYVVGDVLTITHASAAIACKLLVTAESGGAITDVYILSSGAFADRAVSATVSAGGSNYAVGDVLQVQGGTFTQAAKFKIATLSGSAAATVTLFEGGGAYTAFPSNPAATTKVGPTAGTGSGCTLTLTTQAIIGTSAIAATGGTGSGATFNLTLTAGGWTAVRDENDYTFNSITDEKEVILLGTVSGGDPPYVGFRSYTATVGVNTRYGLALSCFDDFSSGLSYDSQPGAGPKVVPTTDGVHLLLLNAAMDSWFRITPRQIVMVAECQPASTLTHQTAGFGLGNPVGTATENPYPMWVAGSSGKHDRAVDAAGFNVTGITEVFGTSSTDAPFYVRQPSDGSYLHMTNNNNGTKTILNVVYPVGEPQEVQANEDDLVVIRSTASGTPYLFSNGICDATGVAATNKLFPTIGDDETWLVPVVAISTPSATNTAATLIRLELDGVYWASVTDSAGGVMVGTDTLDEQRYILFQNAHRTERYSYMAIARD